MPLGDLIDADYLQSVLSRHNVTPRRTSGQNFLVSTEGREAILLAAKAGPRVVTELGAGCGTLTLALLEAGFTVRAIEQDETLTKILTHHTPRRLQEQLTLITGDLKTHDWEWAEPYQVVGNIPYNLSGLIVRRLTQLIPVPVQAVFLVQAEVAQRLCAKPPDMHLVSVAVQLWGEPQPLLRLPPNCFWPQPEVDSQLVMITPHSGVAATHAHREAVVRLAKAAFQNRRKQLGGTLPQITGLSRQKITDILRSFHLTPEQRPQELSIAQWQQLSKAVA